MPRKTYTYHAPTQTWRRSGRPSIAVGSGGEPFADELYRPVGYSTVMEARTALGAPADANYVVWDNAWTHLEQAFVALGANDILVLPEREEPYWINSANGFMAAGVAEVDGTGSNGRKDGSRVPIVHNPRLWFAMARARRGILGMGPGVVIQPTDSGFTAPRQPILENEPDGTMLRYMTDGSSAPMSGAATKLIEVDHPSPFFGNFVLRGRDFGGVGYSGLSLGDKTHSIIKRIHFDGCWRGHAGVPNGECAGLGLLRGTYLIENCDFTPVNGTSPIMWNQNTGGTVRNVRSGRPNFGMWTFWRSGGVNTLENVSMSARQVGMNLEQNTAGFQLNWTGGSLDLDYSGSKFHFGINPANGSNNVQLTDVVCSPNAYTPNTMTANVYSTAGVQRRSDVTHNTIPVSHVPAANWIN